MKKFVKILLWTIISIIILVLLAGGVFIYKVKNGFPVSYETEAPSIDFPADRTSVLLFSKATGFRHGESIEAGKNVFNELSIKNNWFLYNTEEGGVFNPEQLARFDAVVFNNATGRLLNDEQQKALESYIENGGALIGIHGAGDDSHHWEWYEENLLGAKFSHHPIAPQLQEATLTLDSTVTDSVLFQGLPTTWKHIDEWYVFFTNPRDKGFNVLFTMDGEKIIPNGNLLWIRDKNFGMGKDHPVAWYRNTGKGRTFYTSIGHDAGAWKQTPFIRMLENAVKATSYEP